MKPRIYVDFNRHVGDNLYWLGADDAWQLKPYYELGWLRHESEVCFFDDEGMEALGCLEYVERTDLVNWDPKTRPNLQVSKQSPIFVLELQTHRHLKHSEKKTTY